VLQVGPQVVGVPQPAALPTPLQPCIHHSQKNAESTPFR
jgi:hypothetical protein